MVKVSDVTARRLRLDIVVDHRGSACPFEEPGGPKVVLYFFFLFNNSLSSVIGGVGVRLLLVNFVRLRKVRRVKESY